VACLQFGGDTAFEIDEFLMRYRAIVSTFFDFVVKNISLYISYSALSCVSAVSAVSRSMMLVRWELWLRGLSLSSYLLRSFPYSGSAATRIGIRFDIAKVSSYINYGGEFGLAVSESFDRQGARDRRTEVIIR
jgi:hypothetical protein